MVEKYTPNSSSKNTTISTASNESKRPPVINFSVSPKGLLSPFFLQVIADI